MLVHFPIPITALTLPCKPRRLMSWRVEEESYRPTQKASSLDLIWQTRFATTKTFHVRAGGIAPESPFRHSLA